MGKLKKPEQFFNTFNQYEHKEKTQICLVCKKYSTVAKAQPYLNTAHLKTCKFVKKILQQRCFSVNFLKFLRVPFLIEYLQWLLLIYHIFFVLVIIRFV